MTVQSVHQDSPVNSPTGRLAGLRKTLKRPQFWFGLLILAPTAVWYLVFAFRPILLAFRMAVVDYRLLTPMESPFVGLDNFRTLFDYDLFWISVVNTVRYAVEVYVLMLPLATLISYCMVNVYRGRGFYQFVVFLPVVVSMVAISLLFRMLMDVQVGTFNYVLRSLNLRPSLWLTGQNTALNSIVAVDVWKGLGFYVVLLTAGFLNIPEEMYDAAKVDGASAWQTFWRVTMPLMSRTFTLVTVLLGIGALQVYTSAVVMTNGGPGRATSFINLLVVSEAFQRMRFGLATAAAFSLLLVILVITVVQMRLTRANWEY